MIRLRPTSIFDFTNGETFVINELTGGYDAITNPTGYGIPNVDVLAVNATRFIFGSYLTESEATTSTVIVAGKEYIASGTGFFVFDTKTVNAGDTFIFMSDGTPTLPSTLILTETGRFSPATDYLPTQVLTSDFTPSLLGIDNTIFPDSIYSVQMNIYTTSYVAGASRPAGTYIVYGTIGDTITISGVTYRINETFTRGSTFTFTGSAFIALYNATTTDENGNADLVYFLCGYYAWQGILSLQNRVISTHCNTRTKDNLLIAWNKWQAVLSQLSVVDGTIDISGCQILLDEITQLSTQL
jgi:hypothetical protein